MGKTLDEIPRTQVALIEYIGEKLVIPEKMTAEQALALLQRRIAYDKEEVIVEEEFDVFPWDGAVALHRLLTRKYGWAQAVPTPGFFGPNPPKLHMVEIDHDKKMQVVWGRIELPNIKGFLQTGFGKKNDRFVFKLSAKVLRESEATVQELFEAIREETNTFSIYRGKALKMRFRDDKGKVLEMPEPRFMNALAVDENMLVYSDHVMRAIDTSLFTPIKRVYDCLLNGISLKRGILLGGTFGTGKTLAAFVAAKYAVEAGVTFLYVPRADELADAITFAKQYQSPACVVFCEDIDRVMDGERSVKMDDILNIVDGIDSKYSNIMVVLTTNNMEKIHAAMLRPGRLDAVVEITTPDAKAVEKLLRIYGKGVIASDADLRAAGELLQGNIPAVIAEVVKRVKLSQLKFQQPGEMISQVGGEAVVDAAATMKQQIDLLQRAINGKNPTGSKLEEGLADVVKRAMNGQADATADAVGEKFGVN